MRGELRRFDGWHIGPNDPGLIFSSSGSAGLTTVKTLIPIQVGHRQEYEPITFILTPTALTTPKLRRSIR